jgi:putative Ca2+/H+ antiporter (TMEM165/GDT1 family)
VWSGVTVAYSLHVIVAVLVGGLLSRLPSEPVRYTVGAVFVIAGVFLISSSRRVRTNDNADSEPQSLPSWRSAFMMSVATVGVAEFADLTQLTTASLAATRQSSVAVAIGAACALAAVAGLAVGLGHVLVKRVRMHLIQRAAGALFVVLGALSFV